MRAVADRAMAPVNDARLDMLEGLHASGHGADVASLVRAFVLPSVDLVRRHGERGPHVARFLGRVTSEPGGNGGRPVAANVIVEPHANTSQAAPAPDPDTCSGAM